MARVSVIACPLRLAVRTALADESAAADAKPVPAVDEADVTPAVDGDEKAAAGASAAGAAAAPAEAKRVETGSDESMAAQLPRYSALLDEYSNLDFVKNRVKRTGWARLRPGYKIFCCGNSAEDIMIILTLFAILYVCVGLFFWGLLEFYLATQSDWAALYTFAGIIGLGWTALAITVASGECAYAASLKAEKEAGDVEGEEAA